MERETVLVTGATGRIGRHLVRALDGKPVHVRAMTRRPDQASELADTDAELVKGDFADPESLDDALAGVDRAFLLSPVLREMADLQRNFVDAAERTDLEHVVKLSAAGADADSMWDIARWHGEIEDRIETSEVAYTHLRPVFYMQNLLEDPQLKTSNVLARPVPSDTRINMIDTRDVAAAAATALTESGHTGTAYKLTGRQPVSLAKVAETLSEVMDQAIRYREVSPDKAVDVFVDRGSPEWLAREQVALFQGFAKGAGEVDTDAIERVLGRQPRSLREFVDDHFSARS